MKAFAYFGYAQTSQYRNYDDGYRMGKLAMAILDRFNARNRIASVSLIVYGFLNIWKEPFQATIESLQYSIDKGFKIGDQDNALLNSVICGRQEILAGKNLLALSKKLEHVCRAMVRILMSNISLLSCYLILI